MFKVPLYLSCGFLLCFGMGTLFAPFLAPYPPDQIDLTSVYAPPSFSHIMGTDDLGRDIFSRILYGGRISLTIAVVSVLVSLSVGILIGGIGGYFGGVVDGVLMRFVDVMLCFPTFFLILAVIAFLDPSILNITFVIGLTSWMGVSRLVRAEFLKLKDADFILASRMIGLSPFQIVLKHLLPNALPPVVANATLSVGSAVLMEAGLSFLGLGVQPPTPSLGNMLIAGKDTLSFAWWISVFPGLCILFTVLSLNYIGEYLEERVNPRPKKGVS